MATTNNLLTSKDGEFVTVQMFWGKLYLCTVSRQGLENKDLLVEVHRNSENQFAYCFKRQSGSYFPKVDSNGLTLEKIDDLSELKKHHRFEKWDIKSSEHYGLRSVVEPRRYLHVKPWNNGHVFSVSETDSDCVAVTDEFISNKVS